MPRGIGMEMKPEKKAIIKSWSPLFAPLNVYDFDREEGGTDIEPLGKLGTPLAGLSPDPQRYFDVHARAEHYAPVVAPPRMSDAERAAGSPPRAASAGEPGSAGARMITSPQRRLYSTNQITVAALPGRPSGVLARISESRRAGATGKYRKCLAWGAGHTVSNLVLAHPPTATIVRSDT